MQLPIIQVGNDGIPSMALCNCGQEHTIRHIKEDSLIRNNKWKANNNIKAIEYRMDEVYNILKIVVIKLNQDECFLYERKNGRI